MSLSLGIDELLGYTGEERGKWEHWFHIFFPEVRHWAQIATAVRNAGFVPPGDHDLLCSSAVE